MKAFNSHWNYRDNAHEFNSEKLENVKTQIDNLCPPWVIQEPPSFDDHNYDIFMDLPFTSLELESVSYNLKSSAGLDRIDLLDTLLFLNFPTVSKKLF